MFIISTTKLLKENSLPSIERNYPDDSGPPIGRNYLDDPGITIKQREVQPPRFKLHRSRSTGHAWLHLERSA